MKCVILRNLWVEPEVKLDNPLDIQVFFTIHPFYDAKKSKWQDSLHRAAPCSVFS